MPASDKQIGGARGFLDHQPFRKHDEDERSALPIGDDAAQPAHPLMAPLERLQHRIGLSRGFGRLLAAAIDLDESASVADERLDPRRNRFGHPQQLQRVARRRGIEDDEVVIRGRVRR